ncbi:endoplasmic reticulum protein [Lactarius quietus]|nr:endoplasmic reticulum protein [Lactarius quietus]
MSAPATTLDYLSLGSSNPKWSRIPPPPGFSELTKAQSHRKSSTAAVLDSHEALKVKRAWDFAISPVKSLPMQAFMLYMSGGGVQIFSMGIVAMLLLSPFKNLSTMNTVLTSPFSSSPSHLMVAAPLTEPFFAPFAPGPPSSPSAKSLTTLPLQKLAYLGCNILTLALGLWKCRSMGLLPTGTGDWLAFESRGPSPEISLF